MSSSRRDFLVLSAAAAAAGLLFRGTPARGAQGPDPKATAPDPKTWFDWRTAGEDAWAGFEEGGNTLVVMGKNGAILVDCKNAPFGVTLRQEAELLGQPIRQVINTHHHADHTGGNHAFVADVPILAHPNCKVRIAGQINKYISQAKEAVIRLSAVSKTPEIKRGNINHTFDNVKAYHDRMAKLKPSDFEPTQTTTGDTQDLEVVGVKMVLSHFGPGHTDNDVMVRFPSQNLIHAGDLLFNKRHPYVDREAGATTRGWQESLRRVIALCDAKTVVVPGHGDVAGVDALKTQSDYFDRVREIVAAARKEGKNKADVQRIEPTAFPGYEGSSFSATLRAVFEELEEEGAK
jgi:glyoxylase-like metal-dependent hydrolase (beta-lactamase superfamily II)